MADNWHWKLGQFLTGRIKEPELFKAAESPDTRTDTERHCEAWFYAGTKRLLAGDQASASKYFENCVATHMEALIEYGSAVHELRFLKAGRGGE